MQLDDPILDELLDRWEQLREQGSEPSVEKLCGDQLQLADPLRAKITALREMDEVMGLNKLEIGLAPDNDKLPDIPGYEMIGRLGYGGMGIVYKARHLALNRLVAVKFIASGRHGRQRERSGLQAEAQTLAQVPNSHIVQIFDVGEHEGRPFYTMEFVDGESLARKISAPWIPERAAELVETIARALQAAHERGIIHRDLKPGNVLIATDGTPKVADFGLAKYVDEQSDTSAAGSVVGTPNYMAPEQASGKSEAIGRATDVYGMGAILYELLTGRPPFQAKSSEQILLKVIGDEPESVRRLSPAVARDLEAISLKCLQKNPASRYDSALALAEDIRRYLNGNPTLARPLSRPQRARMWYRRNPAIAGLLVSIVAVTIIGFAAVIWQWRDAVAAREHAVRAAEVAQRQRELALQTLNRLVFDVQEQLRDQPRTHELRESLLTDALHGLKQVVDEFGNDSSVDRSRAVANQTIADIERASGRPGEAIDWYSKAHEFFTNRAADHPEDFQPREDLLQSCSNLGDVNTQLGNLAAAREYYEQSLQLARSLAEGAPGNVELQRRVALLYGKIGDLLRRERDLTGAQHAYEQTLGLFSTLYKANSKDIQSTRDLANVEQGLGSLLLLQGRFEHARQHFDQHVKLTEATLKLDRYGIRHKRAIADSYISLGESDILFGNPTEARLKYAKAVKLSEELLDSDTAENRRGLAKALEKLGDADFRLGDMDRAHGAFERALMIREDFVKADPKDVRAQQEWGHNHQLIATSDMGRQEFHMARRHLMTDLALATEFAAVTPTDLSWQRHLQDCYLLLGDVTSALDDSAGARQFYEQSLKLAEDLCASGPQNMVDRRSLFLSYARLADSSGEWGEVSAAWDYAQRAHKVIVELAASDPAFAPHQRDLSVSFARLGDVSLMRGDVPGARRAFGESRTLAESLGAGDESKVLVRGDLAYALGGQGRTERQAGDFSTAAARFEYGIAILQQISTARTKDKSLYQAWLRDQQAALLVCKQALQDNQPTAGTEASNGK